MKVRNMFLSALALSSLSLKAGEKVLFYDTFDHYGYYVENFNPGVQISEFPPSIKSLNINPEIPGKRLCAFKTPMMIRPEVRAARLAPHEINKRLCEQGQACYDCLRAAETFSQVGHTASRGSCCKICNN